MCVPVSFQLRVAQNVVYPPNCNYAIRKRGLSRTFLRIVGTLAGGVTKWEGVPVDYHTAIDELFVRQERSHSYGYEGV